MRRPTDWPWTAFPLLALPAFVLALIATRLVHVAGHLAGGVSAGADALGFFAPLVGGGDLAFLNYPSATFSGTDAALPYLLGGSGVALALAVLATYLWPPGFSVAGRLLPQLFSAVLLVHGVVEPLADLAPRGESGLASELIGVALPGPWAVATAIALALLIHLMLRLLRLAALVTPIETMGQRGLFVALVWTVPEAAYQVLHGVFVRPGLLDLASGATFAVLPALAAWAIEPKPFYERVDRSAWTGHVAAAWAIAAVAVALWWVGFGGFTARSSFGVVWKRPGAFDNVRPEIPLRRPFVTSSN